jgi:predicted amidohydrolase YtcJ
VTADSVSLALDAIEAALTHEPRPEHRHRIEHAGICRPSLVQRAAALGVVVVSNPAFLFHHGERYRETLSEEEQSALYAAGDLAATGVTVAAASDAPVTPPAPLASIRAAIMRRDSTGQALPGRGLDPRTALALVTRNAASSARAENTLGTVAAGRVADLVLLSAEPHEDGSTVWWTVLGGTLVYRAPDAPPFPA